VTSTIISFFIDHEGLAWAATPEAINILEIRPDKPFHTFSSDPNIPGTLNESPMWSVYEDSEGVLWIGTLRTVLSRCDRFVHNMPTEFTHFQLDDQVLSVMFPILEDDQGHLWVGSVAGLSIFDRDSERFIRDSDHPLMERLSSVAIYSMYKDKWGQLWIAGFGSREGIYIYDPETENIKKHPYNVSSFPAYVSSFHEDREGNMWMGHIAGDGITVITKNQRDHIFAIDSLSYIRYTKTTGSNSGLSSSSVVQVYQDKSKRIWVATADGLNLFNPQTETFHSFDESDGLPHNFICGMLEDDHGNLWMSTLNGICKVELTSGYGKDVIRSVRTYGEPEGIVRPVFNEMVRYKSSDGWMYFGGMYGLTVFHPDSIRDSKTFPPVYITSIQVNNRSISSLEADVLEESLIETEEIALPYNMNFLSFEYVALNYPKADRNRYKYIMDGLDKEWVDAGTRRYAEYRDLKPGEYTFQVIACNEDGLWNEKGASIGIVINPPWYRSVLAYLIYSALFLVAIYGIIRWRTWRIRKERDYLELQVKERTKVIENQKEEILSANTVLERQKGELEQQKEELEQQKEELEQQTEEILTVNDRLEQQKEELEITLENLQQTQDQLIQSEKLAALGGLVAGVAHEINTPVGISVTAASSLAEETRQMADKYRANKISRSEFKDYLNTANQSARLILANMEKAATMVQSFKQVSVDQSTEQKRKFKLKEYSEDVIRSLYPRLKGKQIEISVAIDDKLELDSFPGAYSQVMTNLILNSLVHGFAGRDTGTISLSAYKEKDSLIIEYSDDGIGVPQENIPKLFDPFYTTNKKAGTGLGLHIVHNLVSQKLAGEIHCTSQPGVETRFILRLPITT
jgi:signal transduction histidine kinase